MAMADAGFRHPAPRLSAAALERRAACRPRRFSCTPNRGWAQPSSSFATLSRRAAMGARIVLECQPPLLRLFRQSLAGPGEPVAEVIIKGEALPPFDRQVPLMSLPHLLGTTLSTIPAGIPYLRADEADIAVWRERLASAPRPRIGLVWAGNRRHENDHNRSLPATGLAPLVSRFDAAFFSLQVPVSPSDLACFPAGRLVDLCAPSHRLRRHCRRAGGARSRHYRRYGGGASGRRARPAGLAAVTVRPGMALATRSRG